MASYEAIWNNVEIFLMIKIFQIYYDDKQLDSLDKSCIPYDNSNDSSLEYEYGIILREYENNLFKDAEYVGFLSWLFQSKTGLTPTSFKGLIEQNKGYDVYFKDPYPFFVHNFGNVWRQGECHKGLPELAQSIFKEVHNIDILKENHTTDRSTYCNYWVGNKQFIKSYIEFTKPIRQWMITHNNEYNNTFFSQYGVGLFPYIMERCFTTFLYNNQNFKAKGF